MTEVTPARRLRSGRTVPSSMVRISKRHAGDGVDHFAAVGAADRADQAGSGAGHLLDGFRTFGHVRLAKVARRHRTAALLEQIPDMLRDRVAPDQRHPHHFRDGLAGDVVLCGAEPAAANDGVRARERETQAFHHTRLVVADLGLVVGVDAGQSELLADPGGIGVDDLA